MTKLTIPAKDFRRFEDPFVQELGADRPIKYRFYARVADIPAELLDWMDTNPRDQNLNTDTSKAIRESLLDDEFPCFHLWNRGILISADKVTFDNRKDIAEIKLEDTRIHGNIDGGHTLRIILQCQEDAAQGKLEKSSGQYVDKMPNQYVEIEVITGLTSPEGLAEARNTSVAVDLKSMEELRKSFDVLKDILENCVLENGKGFMERIEFRQNQMRAARGQSDVEQKSPQNWIDVREVISILNMFNQKLYPNTNLNSVQPIQSFSGKEVGLKKFLQAGLEKDASDEECRAVRDALLRQMEPIIPDIFKLWDHIECHFTEATKPLNKRYGTRKYSKSINNPRALFSDEPLKYVIPKGIMYPLVGAFRALVRLDERGNYYWAVDPLQAWDVMKATLAAFVMDTSEELANNPANVGRSSNLWSNLFSNMYVYALQREAAAKTLV